LETLFALARTTLITNNVQSCATSYGYLEKAKLALDDVRNSSKQFNIANLSNSYRCVSQVHYYLAAKLYQDGRYASAIQFLEGACQLGLIGLELRAQSESSTDDDITKQSWRQLEEQLYRRWELLGVCHSKIGNRPQAYEAFLGSIRAFPYTIVGMEEIASRSTLSQAFEESPAIRQLGVLVDRVTYLATFELLLNPKQIPIQFPNGDPGKGILGILLERQLVSLQDHLMNEAAQGVSRVLVQEAFVVYEATAMPIRAARVLLQYLNLAYRIREKSAFQGFSLRRSAEVTQAVHERCATQV
jgi:separase